MDYRYNDGGRKDAGFKGNTGDCVTRAIAIASGLPYLQVYQALAKGTGGERRSKGKAKRGATARNGVYVKRKWFKDYMATLGFRWVPTMFVGQGCKVHLKDGELPMGRLVVSVSRHYTAVIDGVIHDTYNPADRGAIVYPASYPCEALPKGATQLDSGAWVYDPDRCVYGYWVFQG